MGKRVEKSTWKQKCYCLRQQYFANREFCIFFDTNIKTAIRMKDAVRNATVDQNHWVYNKNVVFTTDVIKYFNIDIEFCFKNEKDEENGIF